MEKYYKHLIIAAAIIIAVIIILFFFRYDIKVSERCTYKLDRLTGTTYQRCGYQYKWQKID